MELKLDQAERDIGMQSKNKIYFIMLGLVVGAMAAYHDPATKRPFNYWELYNSEGGLGSRLV